MFIAANPGLTKWRERAEFAEILSKEASMRSLALLILTLVFAWAVVLPCDEIGTHELPAVHHGKVISKARGKVVGPLTRAAVVAFLAVISEPSTLEFQPFRQLPWRSVRTASNVQLNSPLVI
jgi:hypothetical protein